MRIRVEVAVLALVALVGCGGGVPEDGRPAAPADVTTDVEHGIVTVGWAHDGVATSGYRISRSVALGAVLEPQAGLPVGEVGPQARSFADRSAVVGEEYVYEVVAFGPGGASSTAASGATAHVASGVTLRTGTYIHPLMPAPEIAAGMFFYLSPGEVDGIEDTATATLTGPAGWNGDAPLEFALAPATLAGGFAWVADVPAVVGSYQLTLDTGSAVHTAESTLTSLDTLPLPTGVTVSTADATTVAGSWDVHPDAVSYTASLFRGPHDAPERLEFFYTRGTQHTFTGLSLEPGDYFYSVATYPIDRTDPLRLMPPERFDAALNATGLFQIE